MFSRNSTLFDLDSISSEVSITALLNVFIILIGLRLANSLILISPRKDQARQRYLRHRYGIDTR
jgi:hypothetical protein